MEREVAVGRKRDPIWEHVQQQSNGYFTCNYCGFSFKGGATRIKSHLTGEKGGGIRACLSSPLNNKIKAPSLGDTTSSSLQMIPSHHNNPIPSLPLSIGIESRSDLVHNLIVEFLISNKLPFETIEQPSFRSLLDVVSKLGPGYELPANHSSLFEEPLPIVKDVLWYIQTVCNSWNTYGCTIMVHLGEECMTTTKIDSDYWDFISHSSVYSPEGVIFTYAFNPSCSYTDSNFRQLIYEIDEAIKRQKMQLLCDFERIHKGQYDHLRAHLPNPIGYRHTCICATQQILMLLRDMSKGSFWVSRLLLSVDSVYRYLPKSEPQNMVLRRDEKVWAKYDHPFFKLQAIMQYQTDLDNRYKSCLGDAQKIEGFWREGEKILRAIGPLIHILHLFDNFVPNIGYFYQAILKAEFSLKSYVNRDPYCFSDLWELFRTFKDQVFIPIHYIAAYLNPVYMFENTNLPADKLVNKHSIYAHYMYCYNKNDKTIALEKQRKLYCMNDSSLFSEEAISMLHIYHPVRWWQEFGGSVPQLQQLAIRVLSQRINCLSHFSHKHMFERQADMLSMNAIMLEEFRKLKQQGDEIFKPIDLSILDTPLF